MSFLRWVVRLHGIYSFKGRTLIKVVLYVPPRIDSCLPTYPRWNDMHGWRNDIEGWIQPRETSLFFSFMSPVH